jgi:hypothetical protein
MLFGEYDPTLNNVFVNDEITIYNLASEDEGLTTLTIDPF